MSSLVDTNEQESRLAISRASTAPRAVVDRLLGAGAPTAESVLGYGWLGSYASFVSSDVQAAYSARAADYVEQLGSVASLHPSDRALITSWAAQVEGSILDAGCGPGHWTAHLIEHGNDVRGVDQVSEFIDHARRTYPHVSFELGDFDKLPDATRSVGGILAWYSLIHHEPSTLRAVLEEFARVLHPDGALLLGFFIGPDVEPFDHAVATAYRWSPEAMSTELRAAGFEVIETHTRVGRDPKPRPHGAIVAQLGWTNERHEPRLALGEQSAR